MTELKNYNSFAEIIWFLNLVSRGRLQFTKQPKGKSDIRYYRRVGWHQHLCLEAWHNNSAHTPLNRDGIDLLPHPHLHLISGNDTLRAGRLQNSPEGEQEKSCRRSPSFWASHSGQTSLGNAHIIFLARRRSKSSLQYENQYGVRSVIETSAGFETVFKQRLAHTK